MSVRPRIFWQFACLSVAFLTAGAAIQIARNAAGYNIRVFRTLNSGWVPLFLALFAIIACALFLLIISWTPASQRPKKLLDALTHAQPPWRIAGMIGLLMSLPAFSLVISQPFYSRFLDGGWTRTALLFCLSLAGMFLLKLGRRQLSWPAALAYAALAQAVFYSGLVSFSAVSSYPFSRTWSEVSRYYGASLFLAERIYGTRPALTVLHPAYHLLLTPPFLLGNLPIWVHRLWQVVIHVGLTIALASAIIRRWGLRGRAVLWILTGWAFLFLMQGPIQTHLLLCALIVVWGAAPGRFRRTTMVVLLASLWAGWCRINWFPVPGMLAAVLYFLEIPLESPGRRVAYLWKPAFWFLFGTAASFASNLLYMRWSGNGTDGNYVSSLSSDLLWYRLWPNPTNPLGVLPGLLLVSAPLVLAAALALHRDRRAFHPMQQVGLFGVLVVLLLGGLVVSIKIGGGHDLHNLDAFLIMLLLVGGGLLRGPVAAFRSGERRIGLRDLGAAVFILVMPIWYSIRQNPSFVSWNREQARLQVQAIQDNAERAAGRGEAVLFISQRHLIAFDEMHVPLVPEYEQDYLMEMVMSHNRPYLDGFQADLRSQRFGMIVLFPQAIRYDRGARSFSEENNYWVDEVSAPLLCNYEPLTSAEEFQVVLYVPRDQPCR